MVAQFRVLMIHLVSNGDCLYATAIAKQIKIDFPECHLTWIISDRCSQVLKNNPFIDEILERKISSIQAALKEDWMNLKTELTDSGFIRKFDKVCYTQFFPENLACFDGTIRSSLFRSYPINKISDVRPVVCLDDTEVQHVRDFAKTHNLSNFKKVILFECTPGSGQSFVNIDFALQLSERIINQYPRALIILSTHLNVETNSERIIVANTLSFRENAELANHCNLMLGCSSGITWLCTGTWQKNPLPMIQLLSKSKGIAFASVSYDFSYWGLDNSNIIEIYKNDIDYIFSAINVYFSEGIEACKTRFHKKESPNPFHIKDYFNMVAKNKKLGPLFGLFSNFYERNGFSLNLIFAFIFIFIQGVMRIPIVLLKKK